MKNTRLKLVRLVAAGLAVGFASLQLIQPDLSNASAPRQYVAPPPVEAILKRSCYDCHSNQTNLKWFDKLAPASWLVAAHIKQGRQSLNFSQWDQLAPNDRKAKLYLSINDILASEMPLPSYLSLHLQAKVTAGDIAVLKQYLLKLSLLQQPAHARLPGAYPATGALGRTVREVKPAPNGIRYRSDYHNWIAISTTDRFDNGSMRVIYGNAVVVKAIAYSQINPWPDGTIFTKVAWSVNPDTTGLIRPGNFIQVEFMIKDRRQTDGAGPAGKAPI